MNKLHLNTKLIGTLSTVLFCHNSELIAATDIGSTTWYSIMKNPNSITIKQLLSIANGLCIPVRRLFSTNTIDYIGHKYEYIVQHYKECYYDANTLQSIVNDRPDITWKQAAKVTNMSRQRLRDSLLAVRRTPVTRFLDVCEIFGINPFDVLVDPNQDMECTDNNHIDDNPKHTDAQNDCESTIRDEIKTLRRQLNQLNCDITDLTKKYERLLSDHKRLKSLMIVNIGHIKDSYPSIVSEQEPGK